jgi:WD40 repeat protein
LKASLAGHADAVTSLVLSPDAKVIYSGSLDGTVRAWDIAAAALRRTLATPAPIQAMALLGDGNQIATGHADNVIRIWAVPQQAAQGQPSGNGSGSTPPAAPVREIKGHSRPVTSLAVVRSAPTQFISGSLDGTLRHWDSSDGREIRQLAHGGTVAAVDVRSDGTRFVSAGEDHVAKLWNAADGQLIATIQGDQRANTLLARTDRAMALAQGRQTDRQQALDAADKAAQEKIDAQNKAKEAQRRPNGRMQKRPRQHRNSPRKKRPRIKPQPKPLKR